MNYITSCDRTVYGRFEDENGYRSRTMTASTVADKGALTVAFNGVNKALYKLNDVVTLTITPNETPLNQAHPGFVVQSGEFLVTRAVLAATLVPH